MVDFKVRKYDYEDLEWCGGRMAHLREKGASATICGADPSIRVGEDLYYGVGGVSHRPTLSLEEARRAHRCKSCVKRVHINGAGRNPAEQP